MDPRPRPTTPYDWSWSFHPSVLIGTGLLGALYFYGIGPLRRKYGWGPPASPAQIVSFSAALLILFLALNGPVHDLSDYYLFSVHMVQHLILTQLMPPLLLLGLPSFVLRPLVGPRWVLAVGRWLTRPAVAFLLYTVSFTGWHLQPAYDLMM